MIRMASRGGPSLSVSSHEKMNFRKIVRISLGGFEWTNVCFFEWI